MAVRNPGAIDGVGMVATPGRMALAPEFAAARMLPFVRRFVPGVETFTAMPFRLDWLGRLTAAAIRVTGDRAWPLGVQAWNPGSMEDDLLRERLEEGFDVTGWGVVSELANWANTGRLEVPGVSPDLVAELQQLNLPLLLVSSPADGIVTAGMAARRTAFPRARVHQYVVPDFGHCDIVLGRRAPEMVWRPMLDWLEALA